MKTETKKTLLLGGSLATAITASACCIGPLVLAALGIGGAAVAVSLEPYRPWFIVITVVLLAGAFFLVYRRPSASCAADGACEISPTRKSLKVLLWIVTVLALGALTFPYYVSYLL